MDPCLFYFCRFLISQSLVQTLDDEKVFKWQNYSQNKIVTKQSI